ncbi:hypothetical protein [Cryptosporangium phraense]|uniref:Uncharacterized protein n=1 Tax=Cryptosporangium phraense TaxID=2593070 RepID=A0A545ASZ7_9ACTN|nr:hypothetical protein [Cryptosporangium phraense]TQS44433.1 hypothetical protein FL583_13250 [Cryptosporangium phraense]
MTKDVRPSAVVPGPPRAVRAAALWWVTAVGAGVVETIGTVAVLASHGESTEVLGVGLGVRAVIYALVLLVVSRLWRGHPWARWVLAVGLGVFGTLSLVAEPIGWLLAGHSLGALLASTDLELALVIAIRAVHVAAVMAACVCMFRPASNAYLRRAVGQRGSGVG